LFIYVKSKINFSKLNILKKAGVTCILILICAFFLTRLYFFKKDSADGRILIWTVTWDLIKEKPIAGFGVNGFQANYMFKQADYLQKHAGSRFTALADDIAYPFNEFLKILVEQGLIGFILMILILYSSFTNKNQKDLNPHEYKTYRIMQALLLGLTVFSCFSYPSQFISFQVLWILCLANIAKTKNAHSPITINPILSKFRKKCIIFILCLSCCIILFSLYKYTATITRWNQVTATLQYSNKNTAIEELRAFYPELKYNAGFVTAFGRILNREGCYSEAVILLEEAMSLRASVHTLILLGNAYRQVGEYQKALEAWETASFMMPSLFEPHYHIARLLFERQHYDEAKQKVKELLNKKIKIDTPEIDRMKRDLQAVLDYEPVLKPDNRTKN
jgi:tetratricopeptide (TPR) repeat protein